MRTEIRTHCPHRQLLLVLGTQSHLRDGGLHRARQPAADLPGLHRGLALRMARIPDAESGNGQQPGRNEKRRRFARIPFSIRCDGTGEETYADGTPKKLVVEAGSCRWRTRRSQAKRSWSTIRWFITDCASTRRVMDVPESLIGCLLNAVPANGAKGTAQEISLALNQTVALDADTKVQLAEFIPDFVVQDGRVYARSNDVSNPAVHLIVTSKKANNSRERLAAGNSRHRRERVLPIHLRAQGSEDGCFHRTAGLARTRPVGGLGGRHADGDRPDVCLLRGSHALLGGSRGRCPRQRGALDRRDRKPQSRRIRTPVQTCSGADSEGTTTRTRGLCARRIAASIAGR